jgi:hypothetical protein
LVRTRRVDLSVGSKMNCRVPQVAVFRDLCSRDEIEVKRYQ